MLQSVLTVSQDGFEGIYPCGRRSKCSNAAAIYVLFMSFRIGLMGRNWGCYSFCRSISSAQINLVAVNTLKLSAWGLGLLLWTELDGGGLPGVFIYNSQTQHKLWCYWALIRLGLLGAISGAAGRGHCKAVQRSIAQVPLYGLVQKPLPCGRLR